MRTLAIDLDMIKLIPRPKREAGWGGLSHAMLASELEHHMEDDLFSSRTNAKATQHPQPTVAHPRRRGVCNVAVTPCETTDAMNRTECTEEEDKHDKNGAIFYVRK
uniref:Uncharacterized protein n=1 Tax=Anopheles merus TaxID=30066 RepID=A0A182VH70_ANOME